MPTVGAGSGSGKFLLLVVAPFFLGLIFGPIGYGLFPRGGWTAIRLASLAVLLAVLCVMFLLNY